MTMCVTSRAPGRYGQFIQAEKRLNFSPCCPLIVIHADCRIPWLYGYASEGDGPQKQISWQKGSCSPNSRFLLQHNPIQGIASGYQTLNVAHDSNAGFFNFAQKRQTNIIPKGDLIMP